MKLKSFDDVEAYLRHWCSGEMYDFIGIVRLLAACLSNLDAHALDAELEDLADLLEPAQRQMLRKLCAALDSAPISD